MILLTLCSLMMHCHPKCTKIIKKIADEDNDHLIEICYVIRKQFLLPPERFNRYCTLLLDMKQKYPHHPGIVGTLYDLHLIMDKDLEAVSFLDDIKLRFPRYVHGMASSVFDALVRKEYEEALGYFWHCHSLKEFDPARRVFHAEEAAVFHKTLIHCYIANDDEASVKRHYNNLVNVVSAHAGYDAMVQDARERIDRWSMRNAFEFLKFIEKYDQNNKMSITVIYRI